MTKNQNQPADAAADPSTDSTSSPQASSGQELRRRAAERLKRQRPASGGQTTAVETARLVHELQVHQIELETQNEELQHAHAHVETLLAQYSDLYDFAPVGYLTLDSEGAIRQVNVTGARLFGVERSRLVNRRLGLFVAEGDRRPFSDFLRDVFASQAKECCEVTLPKNGSPALVLQIEGTRSVDGQECRAVVLDITQRKRLEAQFLQAQKMEVVGRLASGIAHDFNNLLTVINGIADLALTDLKEGAPLRADLQNVRQAGERAASLTRQLLAFSRKQIMKFDALDLSTLVADLHGMLQRLIGENIKLVVVPTKAVGCVMADATQLEQVVMNLAVNARDAMPNGGTLTIETRDVTLDEAYAADHPSVQPGPHVMLAISDTGTGMDEATLARMFEPFFTTKASGKGTGLGLSTVYGIVKQSGGSIWVSSEPGRGTTFEICLPRVEGVVRKIQPAPAVTSVGGAETILVVEDEEAVRRLAMRVLEMAGYTVLTAGSGAEALQLLERHDGPVNLMLTDMVMPGMSGQELVAQIEDLRPQVKILRTSGYTDEAVLHHELLDRAAHFIGKPYDVVELTRKVREVLDSGDGRPTAE